MVVRATIATKVAQSGRQEYCEVPFISDPFKTYGGHQFGARFKSLRNCKRRTFVMKELKKESKEAA